MYLSFFLHEYLIFSTDLIISHKQFLNLKYQLHPTKGFHHHLSDEGREKVEKSISAEEKIKKNGNNKVHKIIFLK